MMGAQSSNIIISQASSTAPLIARASVMVGIAHVPEGRRLFSVMSVRDNLLMGAYLRMTAPT